MGKAKYVNCFRRVIVNVGGKRYKVGVPNGMSEEEINKVMMICRAYLQQYVYVEMVLAECFMQAVESSVRKKKCFKFLVKKKWVDCKYNIKRSIEYYDSYTSNDDFNNEYAMTFYDNMNKDLFLLRDKLANRLNHLNCGEMSGLYANAIVLLNLMNLCIGTYENIARRTNELLHINLMEVFKDFCPTLAYDNSYDFLKLVMGKDFELMSDHAISKDLIPFFDKVRNGVFDKSTMDEATRNATEDMEDEEKRLKRSYVDIDDFMKNGSNVGKSVKKAV